MKAMEILSAIKAQRDKIIDVMIKAMMERDIESCPCWTTVVLDLATGEQTIHQYVDCNSWSPLGDDEIDICRFDPNTRKWFEDYNSVGEICDALDISKRDLIEEMEGWMLNRGYSWEEIDEDGRDLDIVYEWIEDDAAPEIVAKLKEAYVEWLTTDIRPVYEENAERLYDDLIREWTYHAKEEDEAAAYDAALLRGEVW